MCSVAYDSRTTQTYFHQANQYLRAMSVYFHVGKGLRIEEINVEILDNVNQPEYLTLCPALLKVPKYKNPAIFGSDIINFDAQDLSLLNVYNGLVTA